MESTASNYTISDYHSFVKRLEIDFHAGKPHDTKRGYRSDTRWGVQFPTRIQKALASGSIVRNFDINVNRNNSDVTQSLQYKQCFKIDSWHAIGRKLHSSLQHRKRADSEG